MAVQIGFPNRIDSSTLSGGSWEALLPITYLKTRNIGQVARSTNALAASTIIQGDLGSAKSLRIFALINHNLSTSATWRVKLGTSLSGSQVYDTGIIQAWNMDFTDVLPWESTGWWPGVGEDDYRRSPYLVIVALPDSYSSRYWQIEISDTTNADGYVQVGRVFAGPSFFAQNDAATGVPSKWVDLSTSVRSEAGAKLSISRPAYRVSEPMFPVMTTNEGKWLHSIQGKARTVEEVLFCPFPLDTDLNQHYSFLGTFRELSTIEFPFYGYNSMPVVIEESL